MCSASTTPYGETPDHTARSGGCLRSGIVAGVSADQDPSISAHGGADRPRLRTEVVTGWGSDGMADAKASHIDHVKRQDVPTRKAETRRMVCAHPSRRTRVCVHTSGMRCPTGGAHRLAWCVSAGERVLIISTGDLRKETGSQMLRACCHLPLSRCRQNRHPVRAIWVGFIPEG